MRNKIITSGLAVAALGLTLAGCGSSSGSSSAQALKSNASALATSSAVVHAKQVATVEVIDPCKHELPSLTGFKNCVEGKLGITGSSDAAKAKRGALGTCLFEAASADHILTHAGKVKFEQVGAPDCISQILLANEAAGGTGASPSASHT